MSQAKFPLYVKSTISAICQQLATELGAERIDLDDLVNVEVVLTGKGSCILHEMNGCQARPDPMWEVSFNVGAKTSDDPGSYKLIEYYARVNELFAPRSVIDIYDYTVAEGEEVVKVGWMTVTGGAGGAQQLAERSGIRLVTVSMRGVRL